MAIRVLVQAGHLAPREPGFELGTGTAGEVTLVTEIRDKLVKLLEKDARFDPIPMPGFIRPRGIKVDAALFLHADGATNPRASGYSFGYPDYSANRKLAYWLDQEFQSIPGHPPHRADNYTADLRGYYGFRRVDTKGPEVVIEHGFLTNPNERQWLIGNTEQLARAEYRALLHYFKLPPQFSIKKPAWFEPWISWKIARPKNAPKRIPIWAMREYQRRLKSK